MKNIESLLRNYCINTRSPSVAEENTLPQVKKEISERPAEVPEIKKVEIKSILCEKTIIKSEEEK